MTFRLVVFCYSVIIICETVPINTNIQILYIISTVTHECFVNLCFFFVVKMKQQFLFHLFLLDTVSIWCSSNQKRAISMCPSSVYLIVFVLFGGRFYFDMAFWRDESIINQAPFDWSQVTQTNFRCHCIRIYWLSLFRYPHFIKSFIIFWFVKY